MRSRCKQFSELLAREADASPAVAQQEPPRSITRLGGATRFTAPVNDISALATTMGRATMREDLATVFEQAGMPALAMEAQRKLAVGEVTVATLGVVARIVPGPHDAHRQDPHRPMRYDTGRPRAVIRFKISQPRTASLPCPAGLRARRPSPMMDL